MNDSNEGTIRTRERSERGNDPNEGTIRTRRTNRTVVALRTCVVLLFLTSGHAFAQRGQGPAAPPPTAKAAAAIDLTGTWVSVVTEDWVMRMLTPPKGEVRNVPVTPVA